MKTMQMNLQKMVSAAAVLFLVMLSCSAFGQSKATATTVKGEVLDMNCYMAEGAHGASHKSCAQMCVKGGAAIGLLTSSGKVYLLVENHDKPDPYTEARKHAGEQIEVTGTYADRGGVQGLVVSDVKAGSM